MSKSVNSPTARLLQSSRLFSLPRPLPAPQFERPSAVGLHRSSDSVTLHYPILQAVATPRASQARGDWGLKRPLPAKATRDTSTPHIRVYANDTPDCITEFSSAADHTQTRSKWQQMSVPMVRAQAQDQQIGMRSSVYEDKLDFTDPDYRAPPSTARTPGSTHLTQAEARRWKFSGPWLVGMQAGEFNQYLAKTVAGRKDEWREFIRSDLLETKIRNARTDAQSQGEPFDQTREQQLREQLAPTDAEVNAEQKKLRDEHLDQALSSRLTDLLSRFLDLAQPNTPVRDVQTKSPGFASEVRRYLDAPDAAPPVTHPGAGLSYIRTAAVMDNHPVHGPQSHRKPVLARVLGFRKSPTGGDSTAKLGVGGFVSMDQSTQTFKSKSRSVFSDRPKTAQELTEELDPTLEGGAKIWVHATSGMVSDAGTIRVMVERGQEEAIAVENDNVEAIHNSRRYARRSHAAVYPAGRSQSAKYGTSLPLADGM